MGFWKKKTIFFEKVSDKYFIDIDYKKNKVDMKYFNDKKYFLNFCEKHSESQFETTPKQYSLDLRMFYLKEAKAITPFNYYYS